MIMNPGIKDQISKDILACENQTEPNGSKRLYDELIARYTALDKNFTDGLPKYARVIGTSSAIDYRPELKAIGSKLNMILLMNDSSDSEHTLPSDQVRSFIERGMIIKKEEYHSAKDGVIISYISGPKYDAWMSEINIFNERYLKNHPLYKEIHSVFFHRRNKLSAYEEMMGHLRALDADKVFWKGLERKENTVRERINATETTVSSNSNKIFIVHGHDNEAKQELARTLEKGGFVPIILHEQPDDGMTIIEKIEHYSDVCYAVVLYTECDIGRDKNAPSGAERSRARQNVVFEHGYLIAKLGRSRVSALVKGDVEKPGDISGIVYITMDAAGAWKIQLANNMQNVGAPVDLNTFCR